MEKVFEKSTKDQLNPHKGLKFLSALGMVLWVLYNLYLLMDATIFR